ncbi:hypothetical protein [Ottowia thiooxydans]|uniref:hypothetical protein n=1 Tax=Ottowia thiooxydans TaxID=219182 RepID=UPI00041F01D8|nr:hypothetical protein [Ottowia thiooxydans]
MQIKNIAIATLLTAVFAGNAFAAQPASGEGPLFLNEGVSTSTLTREAVRQEAIANPPATDGYTAVAYTGVARKAAPASALTRSEVRENTREAIAHGFRVKSGEMS